MRVQVNLHFVQYRVISRWLSASSQKPIANSRKPRAGSLKLEAESREPKASSQQPEVCTTPLPTPVQGWVASAYILSCAPLLVRGRGPRSGEGGGLPKARRQPPASSQQPEVCTTPLPTPVQGWVASAYILSCAPLLVRGERATQWRGGIAEGTPKAGS